MEWIPRRGDGAESVLHFAPPPHSPPPWPRHQRRREGRLEVVEVDGGEGYFQGLAALGGSDGSDSSDSSDGSDRPARSAARGALWPQYGPRRPVFTYNTNDWNELPPPAHDDYCILGSRLLGLKMVAESRPAPGARVVVYDINPDQLNWIRTVLEAAGEVAETAGLVDRFVGRHPGVSVRERLPHEEANARRQSRWFRRHRRRLACLARELDWHFLVCDLLTDPTPLLTRLGASRSLFFMYLDLFMVWHLEGAVRWVEDHAGMAVSLERLLRSRVSGPVTFLPGPTSAHFQLQPWSPFATSRRPGRRVAEDRGMA